jgi:hypothetical protein
MPAIDLLTYANQTQSPMRRGLIQKITNESVFLKTLKFIPVDGLTYEWGEQTTLGSVGFRAINGAYTPDVGVVTPKREGLGILGGQVNTDRQIANKNGGVARANGIAAKVRKVGLQYDRAVLQGDPAVNPLAFSGLNIRCTGSQLLVAGPNGATLALSMVDQLIDYVVGSPTQKRLVMNKAIRRKLTYLKVAAAGGAHVEDVSKQLDNYNGVPIDVLDEDGDETPILPFTETCGSSTATVSMYCYRPGSDTEGEFLQGLIGGNLIEVVPVGLLGTFWADLIESNIGLGMFHFRAAARLSGLTNT